MLSAISNATSGMMAASRRLEASAGRVAGAGATPSASSAGPGGTTSPDVDYAVEAVEQITAKLDFAANAAVLRTTREMSGKLLDMTA